MHSQGRAQADTPTAAAAEPAPPEPALARHWRHTKTLTVALLLVWFGSSFVAVFFAAELRQRFFGWPLGFWMASQGALLVFLAIVVLYAWVMARIDAAAGVDEDA